MYDQDYEETREYTPGEEQPDEAYYAGEEDPYGASFDDDAPYEQRGQAHARQPVIISTSQAVNLTGTIASVSALFALFLCFADQRSRAVRRFSVQSAGLGALHLAVGMACWILSAALGWVPLIGYVVDLLMSAVFIGVCGVVLVLRVRLMLHAYRGEAYALPVIGKALRRFE